MKFLLALYNLPWGTAIGHVDYLRARAYLFLAFLLVGLLSILFSLLAGLASHALNLSGLPDKVLEIATLFPFIAFTVWMLLHCVKLTVNRLHDFNRKALWWTVYLYGGGGALTMAASRVLPQHTVLAFSFALAFSILVIEYFLMYEKGYAKPAFPQARLFAGQKLDAFSKLANGLFFVLMLVGVARTLADYILSVIS